MGEIAGLPQFVLVILEAGFTIESKSVSPGTLLYISVLTYILGMVISIYTIRKNDLWMIHKWTSNDSSSDLIWPDLYNPKTLPIKLQ